MTSTPPLLTRPEQRPPAQAAPTSSWRRDLVAFVGTVIAASTFAWQAADLIWGLWICSLTFGFLTIFVAIFMGVVRADGGSIVLKIFGGLFFLAFFTIHFGGFHFVHAMFLEMCMPMPAGPLGPRGLFGNPFASLAYALSNYYPMVLATFVARWSDLPFKAGSSAGDAAKARGAALMKPYSNVVRMHLLIFVFIGLTALELSDLAIYPVLAFYFFPWSAFVRGAKASSDEQGSKSGE